MNNKKNNQNNYNERLVKKEILGVCITDAQKELILEYLLKKIKNTHENFYIVTPNPEIITYSQNNPYFKNILNQAQIALCDGVGIVWAGKLLGQHFAERITGVDFVQFICKKVANQPISIGLLGGRESVADEVSKRLRSEYPLLDIVFISQDWDSLAEEQLKKKSIDILFIAFGFPKQEIWMYEHINKIPVRIMIGVGGSFDYISRKVKRAPLWMRTLGFEWIYRLFKQPWRWKRQLALITFVILVIQEKLKRKTAK